MASEKTPIKKKGQKPKKEKPEKVVKENTQKNYKTIGKVIIILTKAVRECCETNLGTSLSKEKLLEMISDENAQRSLQDSQEQTISSLLQHLDLPPLLNLVSKTRIVRKESVLTELRLLRNQWAHQNNFNNEQVFNWIGKVLDFFKLIKAKKKHIEKLKSIQNKFIQVSKLGQEGKEEEDEEENKEDEEDLEEKEKFCIGRVKTLVGNKGYGFLEDESSNGSSKAGIFFHLRDVESPIPIQSGYIVQYIKVETQKGPTAKKVRVKDFKTLNNQQIDEYLSSRQQESTDVMLLSITNFLSPWLSILSSKNDRPGIASRIQISTILSLGGRKNLLDSALKERANQFMKSFEASEFLSSKLSGFFRTIRLNEDQSLIDIQNCLQFFQNFIHFNPEKAQEQLPIECLTSLFMRPDHSLNHLKEPIQNLYSSIEKRLELEESIANQSVIITASMDYNECPVLPLPKEISKAISAKELPSNVLRAPFKSTRDYLNTQFHLLRADCFAALQSGINAFHLNKLDDRDMHLYDNVKLKGIHFRPPGMGMAHCISFKTKVQVGDWEKTKRLDYGNLVCLSPDSFSQIAFWATIVHKDSQALKQGITFVQFIEGYAQKMEEYLKNKPSTSFLMAESPTFFPAFYPVLRGLQQLDIYSVPFEDYLVRGHKGSKVPKYLMDLEQQIEALLQEELSNGNFDDSQQKALKLALTNELTLIQGPPGCGKSFIGRKIVEIILKLKQLDGSNQQQQEADTIKAELAKVHLEWVKAKKEEKELETMIQQYKNNQHEAQKLVNGTRALSQWNEMKIHQSRVQQYKTLKEETIEKKKEKIDEIEYLIQFKKRLEDQLGNIQNNSTNGSPILIITYKNHALDEFLEGCLNFCQNIVRVGGRSKSEKLHPYNLQELLFRDFSKDDRFLFSKTKKEIQIQIDQLKKLIEDNNTKTWKKLTLTCGIFRKYATRFQVESLQEDEKGLKEQLEKWLEMDTKSKKKKKNKKEDDASQNFWETINPNAMIDDDNNNNKKEGKKNEDDSNLDADDLWLNEDDEEDEKILPSNDGSNWKNIILKQDEDSTLQIKRNQAFNDSFIPMEGYFSNSKLPNMETWENSLSSEDKYLLEEIENLWDLSMNQRKRLEHLWLQKYLIDLESEYSNVLEKYQQASTDIQQLNDQIKLNVLRKANIIGMTTTGCAMNQELIAILKPSIILVEEAAEISEPQLLACLSSSIQHLILIGDHKQLQPSVEFHPLVIHNKYGISLFERLIMNGLQHVTLKYQRRMHPQISRLVKPIYDELLDHVEVNTRIFNESQMVVPGMKNRVFFWDHSGREGLSQIGRSAVNMNEVHMIKQTVKYLLREGIREGSITILATYRGQVSELRQVIAKRHPQIRILTVDRYQGDENDVILLSLVRSNEYGFIGFLRQENRLCVALSRARFGLYIFGNSLVLSQNPHWQRVLKELQKHNEIDKSLPLQCPRHPQKPITRIRTPEEFEKLLDSHQICSEICTFVFPDCGHKCQKKCHLDQHVKCLAKCSIILPCNHPCSSLCNEDCGPCKEMCSKTLPCGHGCSSICSSECGECKEEVAVNNPICGHPALIQCGTPLDSLKCKITCGKLLNCGHHCKLKCWQECGTKPCKKCRKKNVAETKALNMIRKADSDPSKLLKNLEGGDFEGEQQVLMTVLFTEKENAEQRWLEKEKELQLWKQQNMVDVKETNRYQEELRQKEGEAEALKIEMERLKVKFEEEKEKTQKLAEETQRIIKEKDEAQKENERKVSVLTDGYGFDIFMKVKASNSKSEVKEKECVVCLENMVELEFEPCTYHLFDCSLISYKGKHKVICQECAKQVQKCPICNQRIEKRNLLI